MRDRLAQDLGKTQRTGTGGIAIGEHQVELYDQLTPLTQWQRDERAILELATDLVLGKPGEAMAPTHRADRSRHVRNRPALVDFHERRFLVTSRTAVTHDDVPMFAQL